MNDIQLIAGSSHSAFAEKISKYLKIPLTPVEIKNFANGEIYVRIKEKVRGDDIFIIQTVSKPVNDNLMELLLIVDALKRASARRINLICPFLGYCRQDRKVTSREPISAKLVADLILTAGANRLVTVDLHADQIQGFYNIPVDHLIGYPQFAKYLKGKNYKDLVIVSPDIGGIKRVNKMADLLGVPIAIIDKIRRQHNQAEVAHMIGDVKNKIAIMIDDMVDTGGSIIAAANTLKDFGAKKIIVCATHPILSKDAYEKLDESPISELIFLDTMPIDKKRKGKKIKIISIAKLFSKVIKRIHTEKSLGALFTWEDKPTAF